MTKKRKIFYGTFAFIFVAGISFYFGSRYADPRVDTIPIANAQQEFLHDADFSLFWDAIGIIKSRYFNADEVTDEELLYGAIRGAFEALDDPYSGFFEPSDAEKFREDLSGSFGGIGAEIGTRSGNIVIIAPLKDTPAEQAGLLPGDMILKVDEMSTEGLSVEDAVKIIRGEPETTVKLLILREGWNEPKEIPIVRAIITVPALEWEMKLGDIAYFKLNNFNSNVPPLFYQNAFEIILKRPNGIVLDLRNNPGGFLDVSIDLAGWFLDRGDIVVREQYRDEKDEDIFFANGNGALAHIPIVILVNGGSASASEILAGALRDNRNVTLIGEKTFGKGTVQEVHGMKNGSSIKVSIAEWLTPNGTSINGQGLEPDYVVEMTEEDVKNGKDPQLEKAIEVLKKEINLNF